MTRTGRPRSADCGEPTQADGAEFTPGKWANMPAISERFVKAIKREQTRQGAQ